jgi:Cof subfamily protein (haloacid dehalogenase superfamily)
MIQLIGIDVDGTLLDSAGRFPPANREAIEEAVNAGVHVALVTGRSYPFARPVAIGLPDSLTLIVSNGAVERGMDGSTRVRRLLDKNVARTVLDANAGHRAATALVFDRDTHGQIVFETMDWTHPGRQGYWARNKSYIARRIPLEDALTEDPIQVMFNGGYLAMRQLAREIRAQAHDVTVSLTEYVDRDFSLVDITNRIATKGHALASCARALGIAPAQVMAIGDNFNDLEMLEFAGTPVVMGNAVEPLKTRGFHATGGQDEAGVAQAIHRFVLSSRGQRPGAG